MIHSNYLLPLNQIVLNIFSGPISWSCRIHQLLLCGGERPPTNECPKYDTKQTDTRAIAPRPTLGESCFTWYDPIYESNKTKLWTYASLNCLKNICFRHLNKV